MEKKDFYKMTNDELLVEKQKMKRSKTFNAVFIGFLAGIIAVGVVSWFLSSKKNVAFWIPMLFPIVFIYKQFKKPNEYKELEDLLKERGLN
jgi:cobalamin biosynthesis protein CobD/CbiB